MNVKDIIHNNWKAVLVGAVCLAVGAYGGPIASKAVGLLLPKALDHVSNQPIEDVLGGKSPFSTAPVDPTPSPEKQALDLIKERIAAHKHKATLADVAKDWGIEGRLDCRVVQ